MQRTALLTQHGKLPFIAPALAAVGYGVILAEGLDTDTLGTFTGETPRAGTQLDAALAKAQAAARLAGCRYGLGSEGAFGPDPYAGVTPWATEVLVWWDAETGHSVHAAVQGPETNYAQTSATDLTQALAFADRVGFPSHGVIVGHPGDAVFAKDLTTRDDLQQVTGRALVGGPVWLETDMRGHRNPTRLAMIGRTATALAGRLNCACPACQRPGYGPVALVPGAVCSHCQHPTRSARARRWACAACAHHHEEPLRAQVSPQHCDRCNP